MHVKAQLTQRRWGRLDTSTMPNVNLLRRRRAASRASRPLHFLVLSSPVVILVSDDRSDRTLELLESGGDGPARQAREKHAGEQPEPGRAAFASLQDLHLGVHFGLEEEAWHAVALEVLETRFDPCEPGVKVQVAEMRAAALADSLVATYVSLRFNAPAVLAEPADKFGLHVESEGGWPEVNALLEGEQEDIATAGTGLGRAGLGL